MDIQTKRFYFVKYAQEGSDKLLGELQKGYEKKGENKVNIDGLTISFDQIELTEKGLETAISSRIPTKEEFPHYESEDDYFRCFSEALNLFKKKPVLVEQRKIDVKDNLGNVMKKRGYIDVVYCLSDDELYNDKVVVKEAKSIKRCLKEGEAIPKEPLSLEGRLVLKHVMDSMYRYRQLQTDSLIRADNIAKTLLSRGIIADKLYSLDELAELFDQPKYHIRDFLHRNGIEKYKKENDRRRYTVGRDLIKVYAFFLNK